MDLHPYDGKERRFRHQDTGDRSVALGIIERLLATPLPSPAPRMLYDLSFYSGGSGVFDRLRLSLEADEARCQDILAHLGFVPPAEILTSVDAEDFCWLIGSVEGPLTVAPSVFLETALPGFIDENKEAFQPRLRSPDRVWFDSDSNVNGWSLVYAEDGWLHYLAYEQG
jgi:hypothetical protein